MSNWLLLRITHRGLTFGLDVEDGVVTGAAPVAWWCRGKDVAWVIQYWLRRGAQVEMMEWPEGPWREVI